MRKNRQNKGFTMAELLIVVAILVVLFGVVAVNVAERQRASTRLEFDAIAKEIFIAAQNHLTAAESQGYPGLTEDPLHPGAGDFGNVELDGAGKFDPESIVYYFDSVNEPEVGKQMLPSYAVNYTGTFIIRYQAHPARVLDVFYSQERSGLLRVSGKALSVADDYDKLHPSCEGDDKMAIRQKYPDGSGRYVVGWYGGGDAVQRGEQLEVPTFEIHNEEQLYVTVSDFNVGKTDRAGNPLLYSLVLVVRGKTSGAERCFSLWENDDFGDDVMVLSGQQHLRGRSTAAGTAQKDYSILLDDITTSGMHFADLNDDKDDKFTDPGIRFKPGEDLDIFVVAYSYKVLTNIARSPAQTTNSLFANPAAAANPVTGSTITAEIAGVSYFRHLENLDKTVSGLSDNLTLTKAAQTTDLDWTKGWKNWTGVNKEWKDQTIDRFDKTTGPSAVANTFYPVNPGYQLEYSGQSRAIQGVVAGAAENAGLFGSLPSDSEVSDLQLIDFDVTASSGNAGALIGTAEGGTADDGTPTGVTVTNVLSRNSRPDDGSRKINASGAAGGLIGSMTNGSVTNSAAALIVSGGTDAGGLIGSLSGGSVTNSYAGGHTDQGTYNVKDANGNLVYNVTSVSGTAGGLIGNMPSGAVNRCYSTCSASGTSAAGGLIGSLNGSVTNSYSTGLVDGTNNVGAFVGTATNTSSGSGNSYLWIVNQDQTWQKNIVDSKPADPVTAVAGMTGAADVTASTAAYTGFLSGTSKAVPYDTNGTPSLATSYGGNYPMLSITDLCDIPTANSGTEPTASDYVSTHYGDWPMPETLVINP